VGLNVFTPVKKSQIIASPEHTTISPSKANNLKPITEIRNSLEQSD
jgi:hypothetical protein